MDITLNKLAKRKRATVVTINRHDGTHWRKLLAFGIVPGATLVVIQRFPAIVIRIGETEVALDLDTARLVTVRVGE
ncbi:MAG: FeoA family protein [bacterium]|jgi:Fe2+ transport system protein FeoA